MQRALLLVFFLVFLLFLGGALGLRDVTECDSGTNRNTGQVMSDGDRMLCYHEAAITQAVQCQTCTNIGDTCQKIIAVSTAASARGKDILSLAEAQRNACLYDVARYTRNQQYCNSIDETALSNTGTALFGSAVSRDFCISNVVRLNRATPAHYLNDPNNICFLSFVFPAVLGLVFLRRT